ncbi:hypothetical protein TWF706_009815 [Orbilia oligospora]|nr:hypothetical protein TWF706_009815 [Orbilia oligospora]KAF3091847.1 hypothetical protein TWF103_011409 [Orbilia oligospora]
MSYTIFRISRCIRSWYIQSRHRADIGNLNGGDITTLPKSGVAKPRAAIHIATEAAFQLAVLGLLVSLILSTVRKEQRAGIRPLTVDALLNVRFVTQTLEWIPMNREAKHFVSKILVFVICTIVDGVFAYLRCKNFPSEIFLHGFVYFMTSSIYLGFYIGGANDMTKLQQIFGYGLVICRPIIWALVFLTLRSRKPFRMKGTEPLTDAFAGLLWITVENIAMHCYSIRLTIKRDELYASATV